ncbi:hypothetical protein ACVGVM_20510 [Pseudonocardia bannensis]|uniref:Uncharacterized protein n=1 Tax=Pseudonocardia bannensis TaxID=630973 RepID=A0A848DFY0_9PSEU|nr:hypothetical protein [Pseudonocardia bannensis]NMH91464.1 hypothetical protein [Pseudonocardia bannensis]
MSQPAPSRAQQQEPVLDPEREATEVDATEAEMPMNRAARRAKAKQAAPSHVGPDGGPVRQGRGPRSHTKRRIS